MEYLKVRNWERWQSYRKDRGPPPWIKLHTRLMHDPQWRGLSDAQRGQLVQLWLLAADRNGLIPADPILCKNLAGLARKPDITAYINAGFLHEFCTGSEEFVQTSEIQSQEDQGLNSNLDANMTHQRERERRIDKEGEERETPKIDKSHSLPQEPKMPYKRINGHDGRHFDEIKDLVLRAYERFATIDPGQLSKLCAGQFTHNQARSALQQLKTEGRLR